MEREFRLGAERGELKVEGDRPCWLNIMMAGFA